MLVLRQLAIMRFAINTTLLDLNIFIPNGRVPIVVLRYAYNIVMFYFLRFFRTGSQRTRQLVSEYQCFEVFACEVACWRTLLVSPVGVKGKKDRRGVLEQFCLL